MRPLSLLRRTHSRGAAAAALAVSTLEEALQPTFPVGTNSSTSHTGMGIGAASAPFMAPSMASAEWMATRAFTSSAAGLTHTTLLHAPVGTPATTTTTTGMGSASPSTSSATGSGDETRRIVKKVIKKKKKIVPAGTTVGMAVPPPTGTEGRTTSSATTTTTPPRAGSTVSSVSKPAVSTTPVPRPPSTMATTTTPSHPSSSTTSTSSGNSSEDGAPQKKKTRMVKSFKLEDVSSVCGVHDAVFARRLPTGGCQFFAWPGTPLDVAGKAIVSMPDNIRTVHSIFGRKNTPVDLVMDVDCPVPPEHWSMAKIKPFQENLLNETLSVVSEAIAAAGETVLSQVVLQSPNLKKVSFHIHTKLKNAAFADYESVLGFLAPLKDKIPHVDLQIYRPNGMLRMFSCMKENHTSAMIVFPGKKWNIGPGVLKDGSVDDAVAALHSICIREPGTFKRLIERKPPAGHHFLPPHPSTVSSSVPGSRDGAGSAASSSSITSPQGGGSGSAAGETAEGGVRFPAVEMPRTAQETIDNAARWLRNTTEVEVGEWRNWIGIGICAFRVAYHFKDHPSLSRPAMDTLQEAWVQGSQNCPSKFKPGDCEHKWSSFDPNKLTAAGDWWNAYQRLGRLSFAVEEARAREVQRQKEREARLKERRRGTSPIPATPSASSSTSSPARPTREERTSASRPGPPAAAPPATPPRVSGVGRHMGSTPTTTTTTRPSVVPPSKSSPSSFPSSGSSATPLSSTRVFSSSAPRTPVATVTTATAAGTGRPASAVSSSPSSTIARPPSPRVGTTSSGTGMSGRGSVSPTVTSSSSSTARPVSSPSGSNSSSSTAASTTATPEAREAAALQRIAAKKKIRKMMK